MATGCPVVATRVGAFEELVPASAGELIEPGDVDAMVTACDSLLSTPAKLEDMRQAARHHAETNFPLEKEARAINAIYSDLLAT